MAWCGAVYSEADASAEKGRREEYIERESEASAAATGAAAAATECGTVWATTTKEGYSWVAEAIILSEECSHSYYRDCQLVWRVRPSLGQVSAISTAYQRHNADGAR